MEDLNSLQPYYLLLPPRIYENSLLSREFLPAVNDDITISISSFVFVNDISILVVSAGYDYAEE